MKMAIIGSGISGLASAYYLHKHHDITVFESNDYAGGHTHSHDIDLAGKTWVIDTGFIVYNDWTYPDFIRLMNELNVPSQPSSMSFSVKCERTGIEYNGTTLNSLFAQRRNLFRPSFLRMIADILRFNKEAPRWIEEGDDQTTLGGYLQDRGYSQAFQDHYIIPMGAAIWSSGRNDMLAFPARYFIRFFHNHGMLSVGERPVWRVIRGGSRSYVVPLTRGFREKIRLASPVEKVSRDATGVTIRIRGQEPPERFDAVVLACHSDQALALLADPSQAEREILGVMRYQANETVLHTDASILPKKRLAWAAWNYHIPRQSRDLVAVTYNMNILQGLAAPETFCVTLNYSDTIDPARVIKRLVYHHPLFTRESVAAQKRHGDISGVNRTYYCGAYWGFGFHEDGLKSALRVAEQITGLQIK
ncbi:MAG: NAD(P)/FAD-dependent oxidoreductase [Gammaproteobacteria bacterium]